MSSQSWSFDQAYSVIKVARPAVEINLGFECQLRAYHAGNFDVYLAQQILLRTRIRELHYLKENNNTSAEKDNHQSSPNPSTSSTAGANGNVHDLITAHVLHPNSNCEAMNVDAPLLVPSGAFKGMGLHDSFSYAPRDANGNIVSGSLVVGNPAHRHKRSFSDAKEVPTDVSNNTPPPMAVSGGGGGHGEDDMEVVTDVEESVSSFRTPPTKSNASSHHSNFSVKPTEVFEESMDSAVTAMSTDAPNSRPSSSSSNSKKILTVVNHNHHKSAFSLANANNSNNNSNNSSQSPIDPSFQQPALPSFLGIGRSMSSSQKHSTSSSKPHHGGNSSSGNSFSTRRSKQPRNHGFSSSGVPSTPSAAMASGALPQTFTPEIGTKNPSCHLSRPGSKWIRVIPPLRGLEREFKCSWCNVTLFQLANVIRIDLSDINEMLDKFYQSLEVMTQQHRNASSSSTSGTHDASGRTEEDYMAAPVPSFVPPQTMRGGGSVSKQSSFKFYDNQVMNDTAHEIMVSPRTQVNTVSVSFAPGINNTSHSQFKPNTLLPPIGGTKGNSISRSKAHLFEMDDITQAPSPSFEMDVEQRQPVHNHSTANLNTIHFSSSFKHSNNSNANSFHEEFPMPMTTGKASTTRNKGFNFDMMDTAPPSTHSSHHNSSNTIANLIASPRKETPRGEKSSGMTPRRLPSLEPPHTFTSQSTDSPRLSEPPAMKRQSSAGSSSVSFHHSVDKGESNSYHRNSSQSSIHLNNEGSQKIPFLPSRKNQLPPATSLGPPYPTTMMVYDESPRLMIPPHRQQQILQQQGVVNTTDYAQLVSSNDVNIYNTMIERPKSAEKKRWLARMNLLQEDHTSTQKIKSMADADDTASQIALNGGKYYYIEYMDWMGKDLFSNRHNAGDVICPGCKNALGHWTWTPSQRLLLDGRLEAPLFRIHKHVVHHVSSHLLSPNNVSDTLYLFVSFIRPNLTSMRLLAAHLVHQRI